MLFFLRIFLKSEYCLFISYDIFRDLYALMVEGEREIKINFSTYNVENDKKNARIGEYGFLHYDTKRHIPVLVQEQLFIGVLIKRCSENMLQICCIFSEHLFLRSPLESYFC